MGFFHDGAFMPDGIRSLSDQEYESSSRNTTILVLTDGEMHKLLCLLVSTHYQRVTDRHAACSLAAL